MKSLLKSISFSLFVILLLSNTTFAQSTTLTPGNQVILRSYNTKYIKIQADKNNWLIAGPMDAASAEVFTIEDAGSGKIAIKSSAGKYVTVDAGDKVLATKSSIGATEKFTVEDAGGRFGIKASNGKYFYAYYSLGGYITAGKSTLENWCKFTVEQASVLPINSEVAIRGSNTRYSFVDANDVSIIKVAQNSIVASGKLTVRDAGNGKIALQATNGKYATIDGNGRVSAIKSSVGSAEKFTVEDLGNGKFALKASNGKYVAPAYSSGGVWIASSTSPIAFTREIL